MEKKSGKFGAQALEIEAALKKMGIGWQELASRVGVKPETMRKALKGYQKAGDQLMNGVRMAVQQHTMFDRDEVRPAGKIIMRPVPVVSWARAGAAEFNYHDLAEFIDETVQTTCKDPNAFALIVEGDSMEPKFSPGDRLIISPKGGLTFLRYRLRSGPPFAM